MPKASDLNQKMKESDSVSIGMLIIQEGLIGFCICDSDVREVDNFGLNHLRYKSLLYGKAMEMVTLMLQES